MPQQQASGSMPRTVDEALAFMHGLYRFGSIPGLDRITRLLELAGNPHRGLKTVHVTGTNGKGSVTEMVASILKAAGYRAGRYVSPYIDRFGERIAINGREIQGRDILRGVRELIPLLQRMAVEGREHPTEFEVVTALAFAYFARQQVDALVLEVGLGGRLDATNVVTANDLVAAVITNVGFDHVAQLGPTLADVAREKAGIAKRGRPVITAVTQPGPRAVIATRCRDLQSPLDVYGRDFVARGTAASLNGQALTYEDETGKLERLVIPLAGAHQVVNCACALASVRRLRDSGFTISEDAIRQGLRDMSWPARFEVVSLKPVIVVDAAHNREGVEALCRTVSELIGERVVVVTGMLADKPVGDMVTELAGIADHAVVTTLPTPRALPAEALAARFGSVGVDVTVQPDVQSAVRAAIRLADGRPIICAGSTYLAGPARRALGKRSRLR